MPTVGQDSSTRFRSAPAGPRFRRTRNAFISIQQIIKVPGGSVVKSAQARQAQTAGAPMLSFPPRPSMKTYHKRVIEWADMCTEADSDTNRQTQT